MNNNTESRHKDKEKRDKQQVAVVTGSSSGIGYETSLLLARNGFYVFATVRKLGEGINQIRDIATNENLPLQVIRLDVNNDKSVTEAINRIANEKGRIDVMVNNAGYGLAGSIEEISMDDIRAQTLDQLFWSSKNDERGNTYDERDQNNGKIVNITSIGGRIAIPFHSIYHATKFALEGLSESIQYEVEPFGIKIIVIEPGAVRSNFWNNMKIAKIIITIRIYY